MCHNAPIVLYFQSMVQNKDLSFSKGYAPANADTQPGEGARDLLHK